MMYHSDGIQPGTENSQCLKGFHSICCPAAGIPNYAWRVTRRNRPEVLGVGAHINAGDDDADSTVPDDIEIEFLFEAFIYFTVQS